MTTTRNNPVETADAREIVITRIFDAPRELVWEAMTDPRQVVHWWGPRGFTTTIEVMDVRPGGEWRHVMRGPDGTEYPNRSVFKEVVKPERIVYGHSGERKGGPGVNFVSNWTFEVVEAGKTKVTIRMVFPTAPERDFVVKEFGAIEGGKQTLERLGEHLQRQAADGQEFVIKRVFAARRETVWKAWTERDRLVQWFGPKGFKITTANLDLRPGGTFHYCLRSPDGHELWGKFVYREIVAPERIVLVNSFSDAAGGLTRHPKSPTWPLEMLSATTFTEQDGKTTMTLKWSPLNATEEECKTFAAAHKGMEQGWTGTLDQLTEYLAGSAV
jgi:uncharacterized protein YndB with AHSA1/START domain